MYVCVHVDMGMNVHVCGMYVYVNVDMGVYVYMDTKATIGCLPELLSPF